MDSFSSALRYWDKRLSRLRYSLVKRLTRKAPPLFLRGQDIISLGPLANGVYDPVMQQLMHHFAQQGFQDFLIDIGANIGLVSCESGSCFKAVHLFEPNPYVASVLKVNCFISLKNQNYQIHEHGLGARDEQLTLHVPYDNWGGAFVAPPENAYDLAQLSQKDGFDRFDLDNYGIVDVQIRNADDTFEQLFQQLASAEHRCGVIKIDVEGLDEFLIDRLLAKLPDDFSVVVFFENRDTTKTLSAFQQQHPGVGPVYSLTTDATRMAGAPRWLNSMLNWLRSQETLRLKPALEHMGIGDFVFHIPAKNSPAH
jgi:FkbM family methyltransferase